MNDIFFFVQLHMQCVMHVVLEPKGLSVCLQTRSRCNQCKIKHLQAELAGSFMCQLQHVHTYVN